MFDDAPLAVPLHRPIAVQGHPRAVLDVEGLPTPKDILINTNLDVELLQPPTGSGNGGDPEVSDHLAPAHAHLLQLGAVDGEHLGAGVRDSVKIRK